jgi:hypothetical protein
MKKKKSGKGKRPRARAVKDLTVSDTRPVKGGTLTKGATFQKIVISY